ncbi:potassium channel, subfamily K, member 13-like [Lycorma delicatula]|uniref:potassium channel, subfamily K, member 13-like n=1 Tax=Lycorma delicatula TaxID=130591 RepID=UPI003F50F5C3
MAGLVSLLRLGEDNVRVGLLAIVLLIYMLLGALMFHHLEAPAEEEAAADSLRLFEEFRIVLGNSSPHLHKLHLLLLQHNNSSKRHWDFAGSFHFVGTIVSTIGYGNTTPQTTAGRTAVIVYGFLGCSSGILFFNLFLERIITLLAYILRSFHLRKLKKLNKALHQHHTEEEDSLDEWKPSVYWVMLCLGVASILIACCASAFYCHQENWSFFEAIYFCFISFATIGFGDYVSTQEQTYPYDYVYRSMNFIFLVLGCCCTYSLFNVTSIVIKQALNWMILRLDCRCWDKKSEAGRMLRRHSLRLQQLQRQQRRRSSFSVPRNVKRTQKVGGRRTPMCDVVAHTGGDTDSMYDSDGGERRLSGELISMKDFLSSNKVSLAVMQKQLYETAQMQRGYGEDVNAGRFIPGTVGPLAIVTRKLADGGSGR